MLCLFLIFYLESIHAQHIIDYTHAQNLEDTHFDLTKKYDINISPEPISKDYLNFPGSCTLNQKLQTSELVEEGSLKLIDEEEHINKLKKNMTELLQLSEQIKIIKQYINCKIIIIQLYN